MRGAVFAVAALRLQALLKCSCKLEKADASRGQTAPGSLHHHLDPSSEPKDSDDDLDHIASATDEAEELFVIWALGPGSDAT
jgi:hypothetical protein